MKDQQFDAAKAHLDEIERLERREERKMQSIRWTRRGAVTHEALDHLRDLRVQEREAILPKDRRCPRCNVLKIASRQWVILVDGVGDRRWRAKLHSWVRAKARAAATAAEQNRSIVVSDPFSSICRSCYMIEPSGESVETFLELSLWWRVDHIAIKVARNTLDETGASIAAACGWSQSKQSKMESRGCLLNEEEIGKLRKALKLEVLPAIPGGLVKKYILLGRKLMIARRAVGISRLALAELMGVSASRVAKLERKERTRVEPRIAESLTSALLGITLRARETDS